MSNSLQRREFLKRGGVITAGAAVASTVSGPRVEAAGHAKRVVVAALKDIKPNTPIEFAYPAEEPAALLDMGRPVEGGVGPDRSIVAFSTLCQHMGCPLEYKETSATFFCGCHASAFDPAKGGNAFEGPSTRGLPRIALSITPEGQVVATGVASGLVYGRACNTV